MKSRQCGKASCSRPVAGIVSAREELNIELVRSPYFAHVERLLARQHLFG